MLKILTLILTSLLFAIQIFANPIDLPIIDGADDGFELDGREWQSHISPLVVGRPGDGEMREVGLRFIATSLTNTQNVIYARLRLGVRGGAVSDSLSLTISGALEINSDPLSSDHRPSMIPRTTNQATMVHHETWGDGGANQLFYYSDDISPIINEIIEQTGWGDENDALILCIKDNSNYRLVTNYLSFSGLVPGRWPATLQVCRSLSETFLGHEIVGRPTDHSATINFASLISLDAYVEYGPGNFSMTTDVVTTVAGEPVDIDLSGLPANTLCQYRLRYRKAGTADEFDVGLTRHFQTQREQGNDFVFTIQADSHIWESWAAANPENDNLKLYIRMIDNATADNPDFHFSMGDYSMTEYSKTAQHARDRYLVQRPFLDRMIHSVPFYLVIGNHEGELGYFHTQGDIMPTWAEQARLDFVPNPFPNGFYSGCPENAVNGEDMRESYFSWEWGDALFVVIDPYWYTFERPFHNNDPDKGGGWAWTLGLEQYNWLHQVVNESDRRWKIIFTHHLVGGIDHGNSAYGRGGIETVKWSVAHNPTFEWGGENVDGINEFQQRRPEFTHGPIHDLLVDAGVSVVVTGHDHFYARQQLDDLVYMTIPQPQDRLYEYGAMEPGGYTNGTLLPNAGHVRFHVSAEELTMDYVRAFLPGEGVNGEVADSHTLSANLSSVDAVSFVDSHLRVFPNPASGAISIHLTGHDAPAGSSQGELKIHDVAGRLVAVLHHDGGGAFVWNRMNSQGQPVSSGVYFATWKNGDKRVSGRMVIVR